jgi:tetratricopeptide (TPR) repeat protein
MRANVFTDAALGRYAGQFVWLAIDTENGTNGKFLARYPVSVLPTFYVLDPRHETVLMRYIGGTGVPQLRRMLDDASAAYRSKNQSSADTLLAAADKLAAEEMRSEAVVTYEKAIAAAPKNWPRLGRAAESLVFTLMMIDPEQCATRALALLPRVAGTASAANVASTGLSCATEIDEKKASRTTLLDALEPATKTVFDDSRLTLSGDDRSGLYEALISAREARHDDAGAKALREQWAAYLEQEAARAKTPEQRAVYDSHRITAYLALGTPEKAIPMLEQSQRDFPKDYNPPARLAVAYRAMKKWDEALAAGELALALAYGPRKIGIYRTRAEVFAAKGDKEAARKTLEEAIAYAKSLPKEQQGDRYVPSLERRIAALR